MPGWDIWFFAVAAPAVLFAGISKGGFGSGAAFASSAILALILPPAQAVALMLPLLMVIDLSALRPYWGKWHRPDARALILGALPGVAAGMALFGLADADLLRLLIGAISVGFVIWHGLQRLGRIRSPARRLPGWAGLLAGLVAGFTSFVSHAGGPPAAVYLLSQRLDKTTFQATTVIVFWAINLMKFPPYLALGLFSADTLWAVLVLAPVAVAGTWLGVRAHRVVSDGLFFAFTYLLLGLTGARLIWRALV